VSQGGPLGGRTTDLKFRVVGMSAEGDDSQGPGVRFFLRRGATGDERTGGQRGGADQRQSKTMGQHRDAPSRLSNGIEIAGLHFSPD
jgi:hypothetical protein